MRVVVVLGLLACSLSVQAGIKSHHRYLPRIGRSGGQGHHGGQLVTCIILPGQGIILSTCLHVHVPFLFSFLELEMQKKKKKMKVYASPTRVTLKKKRTKIKNKSKKAGSWTPLLEYIDISLGVCAGMRGMYIY